MAVMLDSAALRDVPEQFGSDYCKTLSESLTSNMDAKEVRTPRLSRKLPVPPSARTKDHVDVTVRIDGDEEFVFTVHKEATLYDLQKDLVQVFAKTTRTHQVYIEGVCDGSSCKLFVMCATFSRTRTSLNILQVVSMGSRSRSRSKPKENKAHIVTEIPKISLCRESWYAHLTDPLNLSAANSASILEDLWLLRPTEPQYIVVFGKQKMLPRRQLAMGCDYRFAGQTATAVHWHPIVERIKDDINSILDLHLNGALIHFNSGPMEYIGPHSDDERGLDPTSPIVVVCFGAPRRFRFTAKPASKSELALVAETEAVMKHGDAILMGGTTQKTHKHEVRKASRKNPESQFEGKRVSLTFRKFL